MENVQMVQQQDGEGAKLENTTTRKKQKVAAAEKAATGMAEAKPNKKSVYMFLNHYDGGPNCHSLYALDIPDPLLPSPLPKEPNPAAAAGVEEQSLPLPSPLITFPREKYPVGMVAVELDSKLYFLGGVFLHFGEFSKSRFARDVYVFDPICSSSPSQSLKVAPELNTGKSLPLAFAADSKIYVVSGNVMHDYLCRFEVFENGKWTPLQDPPFHQTRLAGHAVVNRKVVISTANEGLFCFDLDSSGWAKIIMSDDDMVGSSSPLLRGTVSEGEVWDFSEVVPPFEGSAEFVEDTLYACSGMDVCSFGPSSADQSNKSHEEELFGSVAYLSPGVVKQHIWMKGPSFSLTHMGHGRFCHVSVGSLPHHVDVDSRDTTKYFVNIAVFKVLKETYCSKEGEERRTYFKGELLHSALFVSVSEAWSNEIFGAFTLPSVHRSLLTDNLALLGAGQAKDLVMI